MHALYYVEQKAKIGSIELSLKPNTDTPYSVAVTTRSLEVDEKKIDLSENTNIRHMDIAPPVITSSIIGIKIPTEPILSVSHPTKTSESSKLTRIICLRCSAVISQKKFSRTLALPSAAWHEMSDALLCHGSHKKIQNGCYPRPGDCLIGEQEIWLGWDVVDTSRVYIGNMRDVEQRGISRVTASLHCHRCRNNLGRVVYKGDKVDWAIIWKHSIKTQQNETPYHVESYFTRELMDASTRHVSYRFIVVPRENSSSSSFRGIRLWMMGGDMNITSSLTSHINTVLGFMGTRVCEGAKAMKVLYAKHTEHGAPGIWADADVIALPLDLCLHLWLILQLSSVTIPPEKRYAQNCRVGYIRYS